CEDYTWRLATPIFLAVQKCSGSIVSLMLSSSQPEKTLLNEYLLEAACLGRFEAAQVFIDAGGDVDYEDGMGRTALRVVSGNDMVDCVQWLLDHGADPNQGSRDGNFTPLMRAACSPSGDQTIAAILMKAGADPNAVYSYGLTALNAALDHNNDKIAQFLREHGAKTGVELIAEQRPETAPIPVNPVPIVDLEDDLFKAISKSDPSAARTALSQGARIDSHNEKLHTPLMASVKKGNAQLVKLLLDHKAGTEDSELKVGMTPLMIAVKGGHSSISS